MASEEQINNQERFNDLQRESKDLLDDYNAGILDSSDFVNVLTSRTSQLVDSIRDVNREKGNTLKADRDLTSSITKISDLTKSLSTPYNDMGKAIRDSSKATGLQTRLSKDLALISERINQEAVTYNGTQMTQLELAESYLATQSEIAQTEDKIANSKRLMSSVEQSSFDNIVKNQREKIEAERQYNKMLESGDINLAAMGGKQKKINDLEREKNIAAKNYAKALETGNMSALKLAEDELELADKRSQSYMSQLPLQEQEFFKKKQIREEARAGYDEEIKAAQKLGHQGALNLAQDQDAVDSLRDEADAKKSLLSLDAQAFVEGQKANKELEVAVNYLEEEEQRVRSIIQAQTLWNLSLGAVGGILKKFGLDNQLITVGLDEGAKAAQSMAEELTTTRREAKGAAKAAELEAIKSGQLLSSINTDYQQALKDGDTARIESLSKEKTIAEERAKIANQSYAEAESASNRAKSLVAKIGGSFKVLGAGIKGTFKGMASEFKALALSALIIGAFKKAFKLVGGGIVTKFISDLASKFKEGISFIQNEFFSLQSYINDVNAGDSFLQQIENSTAKIASNLGLGTAEARELVNQASKVSREVGMLPEELAAVTGELQQAFGTTQKFSTDTVKTMGELTNLFGLTNQEASEFVKLGKLSGQEAGEVVVETRAQIQALKERNNIAISEKAVMQEIAKSSALQRLNAEKFAGGIANAAFSAKKLGMEMSTVQGISDSLLNIEDSIAKEMEAELLIGKDLQLDKARQLALQGDLAGVAEEISGQIGSAADFQKMNVIQQEALAAAVGMTKDQLAETLETQELLAGSGFDDMSKAQEEFRKILKETGSEEKAIAAMREKGAKDGLINQFREISLGEKREQQQRDILDAQAGMAKAAGPLIDAFNNLQAKLKQIKDVIVTAMQPFFKSFGKMVGEGGKAFETMVLPYAKQLGEFMNNVGLRLVDIVKNNGPQIKSVFSGVLNVFGAIYGKVGELINSLLGIKKEGAASGNVFDRMSLTIENIIHYIKNIDVNEIITKVKNGFSKVKTFIMDTIKAVKPIFQFISDKIKTITGVFEKNPGLTKLAGLGSLAITMSPGLIGDLGSKLKDKAVDGLKSAGTGIGNKITESLGLGKLFGGSKKPTGGSSDPLFVQNVGGGAEGGLMDVVGKMGGRKAGIGGGFKKGFKGLMDYAKMAMKGGRAGKVGRARLLRAGKGLLTGQGASFAGGTSKGAAQAAGKIAGAAGRLGKVAGSLGKIAAGGGIGAIVGLAAEASLGLFQKKAEAAAGALDEQIAMTDDAGKAAELEQKRQKKLRAAQNLEIAGTTAKYAGLGATIGSVIPGVGTAAGAAVGAIAGFAVGIANAEKTRKREESAAGKFALEQRRAAIKHTKALTNIELRSAALQAKAAKEGFAKEQEVRLQFAEQLGVSGETAAEKLTQLKNLDIDSTSEAFKSFAQDALNAGNITEEEFAAALKGTISPLDLMEKAAKTSGTNLKKLYNSAIETAGALSNELKKSILEQAGVNEDVINSQVNAVQAFTKTANIQSIDLFTEFEDALKAGFDSEAVDTLRGEDSASKGFQEALIKKFETQGADADQVKLAMELYANQLEAAGEDFDLDDAADIATAIEGIGGNLVEVLQSPVLLAEADAKAKQSTALTEIDESGVLKNIGNLTKDQLSTNEELKSVLESVGVNLEEVAEGGIDSDELQAIKESLTTGITAGLMGVDGSNSNLLTQLQGALQVDDFIIRPGEAPIKFNKDDLLVGGTELDSALGIESSIDSLGSKLKEATFKEPLSSTEPIISLNPEFTTDTSSIESSINSLGSKLKEATSSTEPIISLNPEFTIDTSSIESSKSNPPNLINLTDSFSDFANMNVIQQEALAQAVGMSIEELSFSLKEQKEAAETSNAQNIFEKLQSQFTEQQEVIANIAGMTAEKLKLAFQGNIEGTETLNPPSIESPSSMAEAVFNKIIGSEQTKEVEPDNNLVQANAELKAEVKELKEIMSGFVQQMAQVVNRPVVVELDGNKVGESIGRNSFLVQ